MIKAIVFDCFGVLVGRGFDETYAQAGGDAHADSNFVESLLEEANRGQISQPEFRRRITKRLGITEAAWEKAVNEAELPDYELLKYIKELRKNYHTAILSNVNAGVLENKIPREWLDDCFDLLVLSGEVGFIKPEKEIYEYTAERLGVRPDECVFTDDRQGYIEGAEAVGMEGILYKDFENFKRELGPLLGSRKA